MSWFTKVRDQVEGVAAPVASAIGFGLPSMMFGTASTGIGGLLGLLGGGGMAGIGGMGAFGGGSPGSFGTTTPNTMGQPTSLSDMLNQYQVGPVSQTGSANLSNQGLI